MAQKETNPRHWLYGPKLLETRSWSQKHPCISRMTPAELFQLSALTRTQLLCVYSLALIQSHVTLART